MPRATLIAVGICMIAAAALAAADRPVEKPPAEARPDAAAVDSQRMQGRWAREFTNPQRAVFRVEKVIDGNRETVTTFDTNGNTIESHTDNFQLKLDGNVRVFTYSNYVVTAGRNLGAQIPGPRSYLYKLDGDTLHEVWGLLEGDRLAPVAFAWKRVKN